jgi:hypothetical protein
MNERIRKLAEQADDYADNKIQMPGEYHPDWHDIRDEKFAELIIRECITQCEQIATDANAMTKSKFVSNAGIVLHEGAWGGAKNCSEQIKLHFGVEE